MTGTLKRSYGSMVCMLVVLLLTQMYAFIETHLTVYIKWLHFIVCDLYFD